MCIRDRTGGDYRRYRAGGQAGLKRRQGPGYRPPTVTVRISILRRSFLRVEFRHRLADAVESPGFAAGDGLCDHRIDRGFFFRKKFREHELGRVDARGHGATAHAQAREIERVRTLDDGFQTIVTAVCAGGAQADLAEWKRDVVANDEHARRWKRFLEQDRPQRVAGKIHVRERLDQKPVSTAQADFRGARFARGLAPAAAACSRERFHHAETEIVPRAIVTRAGITETGDYELECHMKRRWLQEKASRGYRTTARLFT